MKWCKLILIWLKKMKKLRNLLGKIEIWVILEIIKIIFSKTVLLGTVNWLLTKTNISAGCIRTQLLTQFRS